MQKTVIIVAGGQGTRMNSEIPKQFLEIHGTPIILHTLKNFYSLSSGFRFIIALQPNLFPAFEKLAYSFVPEINFILTEGGKTRFHTVRNALAKVTPGEVVAVHDAVRPLVSHSVIERCFSTALETGTAVPVIDINESLREITDIGNRPLDRTRCKIVQTPQVFKGEILLKSYSQEYSPLFTDDASVVESFGIPISLVEGNRENIKITTPGDLLLATFYLEKK